MVVSSTLADFAGPQTRRHHPRKRMTQYAARVRMSATDPYFNGTNCWIPECAGMTPESDFRSIPRTLIDGAEGWSQMSERWQVARALPPAYSIADVATITGLARKNFR
jgi:hypothetical protein